MSKSSDCYLSLMKLSKSDERELYYNRQSGSLARFASILVDETKVTAHREQLTISMCYTSNRFPCLFLPATSNALSLKSDKWTVFKVG